MCLTDLGRPQKPWGNISIYSTRIIRTKNFCTSEHQLIDSQKKRLCTYGRLTCVHHVDMWTTNHDALSQTALSCLQHICIHTCIVGMFGSWRPVAQVGFNSWLKQLLLPQKIHQINEKRDWLARADRASGNFRSSSFFAEYFHIVSDTNKLVVFYAKKSG